MTISIEDDELSVGPNTLRRLAAAWPRRATIRTDMMDVLNPGAYDPGLLDYPAGLLPFGEHPDFLAASDEQRSQVNTLAWLAYNERVIAAEEYVANPTFEMLAHGVFPGVERFEAKEAIQQSHVDEVWHTYMHMLAMQRTRQARGIVAEPATYEHPVTNRRLYALTAETSERWERDLLYLLWTAVGEISINKFLDLVAGDRTIQPMHALITRLHARDENAHGPVMFEVLKDVYASLDRKQRDLLVRTLPDAILAFGAEDYGLWLEILRFVGIPRARQIVEDSRSLPGSDLLVTDFLPIQRLARELEIEHLVDFDFSTNQRI
ncbi:diiron oxygenase [Streptosporangium sp. NPDC000396]|uniref:diiron oxygenase n=1 Tax=Streptosporangium sp. NPDC000396 TaxID=3366185 RepID=UPI0036B03FD3